MFIWDEIKYLELISIILLLFIGYLLLDNWKKRKQKQFADSHLLPLLILKNTQTKFWLKATLLLLSLVFIMIALIGPQRAQEFEQMKREGIDIVFALDVSRSMDCEDISPSRLIMAKKIINDLTDEFAGDRVGLVLYAGTAHKMLAVTEDYTAIKLALEGVSSDAISYQGTALSTAIEKGIECFDLKAAGDKALILLTDGEDHQENIDDALDNADDAKINIVTIGIGTTSGGVIPIRENGIIVGNKQNGMGDVITKLQENVLSDIAQKANGTYIKASNSTTTTVENIKEALLRYKKTKKDTKDYTNYKLYYQYFALIALLLILLEISLIYSTKKKTKK